MNTRQRRLRVHRFATQPRSAGDVMDEFFVLVWMPSGNAIVPYDSNPGQEDEGMLVYRSRSAAEAAAAHQQEMYGDDETATAIPLSQLGLKVRETEAV